MLQLPSENLEKVHSISNKIPALDGSFETLHVLKRPVSLSSLPQYCTVVAVCGGLTVPSLVTSHIISRRCHVRKLFWSQKALHHSIFSPTQAQYGNPAFVMSFGKLERTNKSIGLWSLD